MVESFMERKQVLSPVVCSLPLFPCAKPAKYTGTPRLSYPHEQILFFGPDPTLLFTYGRNGVNLRSTCARNVGAEVLTSVYRWSDDTRRVAKLTVVG